MNPSLFYAAHSPYTDPSPYQALLQTLPSSIPDLCKAIQGLIVHYRASGIDFPPERLAEIDSRNIRTILQTLGRDPRPLSQPREPTQCFVGCCRDYALLFVAAMREQGIPARSRVGFAPYLNPNFNLDHAVAEYWNGQRWVAVDPEMPTDAFSFDVQDIPKGTFWSAAEVWKGFRAGKLDAEQYGVSPSLPYKGGWFVRNYVGKELAHLCKHELLLWDEWGLMSDKLDGDLGLVDEVADLLLQGDGVFKEWLELFKHPELKVPPTVMCFSPTGNIRPVHLGISLIEMS